MFYNVLNILTQYPLHPLQAKAAENEELKAQQEAAEFARLELEAKLEEQEEQASGSHLDLGRAPYMLYGVKYIDRVSLDVPRAASHVVIWRESCPLWFVWC